MIELRHLRYFIAVAEELNFRRAAERIYIDPTPLSRTIRDLEERWGVRLFIRTPRALQLTPAGIQLLDHARTLLASLERTKRAVRAVDARYREPLRIAVDESTVQPMMAGCLARWRRLAPEIPLEIQEMSASEMVAALSAEVMDIGFSFDAPKDDAISQQPAWTTLLVAILSPEHELANRPMVSLNDLLSFPAVGCAEVSHSGLHQQMKEILHLREIFPTIAGEARSLPGYLTRVAAGQGVGVASADHMLTLKRKDIVVVPLSEEIHIITYILHKRRPEGLSEVLQRFLTHVTAL